jgi:hypothetical protein
MRWFKQFPWYTLIFALYSPMALIAYNVGQVQFSVVLRSLAIVLMAVFILTALVLFVVRDGPKAGLIVTLALVLFFSYGHVYDLLEKASIGGFMIGRHRYLIVLYGLIFFAGVFLIVRSRRSFASWSTTLTTIAIVLLVFPIYQLISYQVKTRPPASEASAAAPVKVEKPSSGEKLPDVYYIILDTYGRTDVLKKYAGYDNSDFIHALQEKGFYVATCSQSNYAQTALSLSSSLNFNYLDKLGMDLSAARREDYIAPYIKHNAVIEQMRNMGYKIVAFETGYDFSTVNDADILYPAPESGISDFELTLLRSTVLVLADDAGMLQSLYPTAAQNRRDMVLMQLKTLKDLPAVPGPKFIFAHLLIPHWPFIFGPNGESLIATDFIETARGVTDKDYFNSYRGQAIFTSNQILDVVSEIIRKSDPPPIIIIQGDHGPSHAGMEARMGILNAYYFPDGKTGALYPTVTPVNSFPIVFNTFFGADFKLLPDISYNSAYKAAENTTIIPNTCQPN